MSSTTTKEIAARTRKKIIRPEPSTKATSRRGKAKIPPADLVLNESSLIKALRQHRGDVLAVSRFFRLRTPTVLQGMIRHSEKLKTAHLAIIEVCEDPKYEQASERQLEAEISRRTALYRAAGMDALYELATMPVSSKTAQVKLLAAARLAGETGSPSRIGDVDSILRELNEDYQRKAPRIKEIRERIVRFVDSPTTIDASPPELEAK